MGASRQNKPRAKALLVDVNSRINRLKRKEVPEAAKWTKEQLTEWLKYGVVTIQEKKKTVKLRAAIKRYLDHAADSGKTFNTINGYRTELSKIEDEFGDVKVESIGVEELQNWVNKQSKQRITSGKNVGDLTSRQTIQKRLDRLKSLFLQMYAFKDLSDLPTPMFAAVTIPNVDSMWDELSQDGDDWATMEQRQQQLEKLGLPSDAKRAWKDVFFSEQEAADLVEFLEQKLAGSKNWNDQRLLAAIICSAYTGARRSELVRVKRADIDLEAETIKFRLLKGRGKKSFVSHTMPLHSQLRDFLADFLNRLPESQVCVFTENDSHLQNDGILFDDRNTRTKANKLGQMLTGALKGTRFELVSGFHIHRHTLNTMLANAGNDTKLVMSIIGHKTERISLRYQHLDQNSQMAARRDALTASIPKKATKKGLSGGCESTQSGNEKSQNSVNHCSGSSYEGVANRGRTGDLWYHKPAL